MLNVEPKVRPRLDPGFIPAELFNRAYAAAAEGNPLSRRIKIAITRPAFGEPGNRVLHRVYCKLLPETPAFTHLNLLYVERLVKALLWVFGGNRVVIDGAPELVERIGATYSPVGQRHFDAEFMGDICFRTPFLVMAGDVDREVSLKTGGQPIGRNLQGCRIGFDLGGSDRKCAAVIDGNVVFSEEVKWSPYFESDPAYHAAGIRDTLRRAAAHLPRVDAIGGSAAGIYIDNEPRVASLFRGIARTDFDRVIRPLFREIRTEWGGVPFEVANDGDVTALAGSMAIGQNGVLGISMGTSMAAGYIDPAGHLTGWLSELAFVPVDYREHAPVDEWSSDAGCGVQYFSQQAVGRLIPVAGLPVRPDMPLPEKLEEVQAAMAKGDPRAAAIYETIGTWFGYSISYYREFYDFRHLLVLGRVSSGPGGEVVLREARRVLDLEFPELSAAISFQQPDEQTKRHGQAVAAASLPVLRN